MEQENITIKELQEYIKLKDYKPELKNGYFLKIIEEIGELSEAIRKKHWDTNVVYINPIAKF